MGLSPCWGIATYCQFDRFRRRICPILSRPFPLDIPRKQNPRQQSTKVPRRLRLRFCDHKRIDLGHHIPSGLQLQFSPAGDSHNGPFRYMGPGASMGVPHCDQRERTPRTGGLRGGDEWPSSGCDAARCPITSACVRDQASRLNPGNCGLLVIVRCVARDSDSAQDLTLLIPDENPSRDRD